MFNPFSSDDSENERNERNEQNEHDIEKVPEKLKSPTGEPYQIEPGETERIGGAEVMTHTESNGTVAGPKVRNLIENSRERPEGPLWTGYNDSAQEGFREVPIEFDSLFQHNWVCGTTGAGKTTELLNWMVQLAYAGHGFVYFDPKARDSKELLQLLPEDRLDDVVWIEPGDEDFDKHVGINFLEIPDTDNQMELEREIEDRLENLKAILDSDDYWGPRMRAITESMGRAMMKSDKDYSVIDLYFILLNEQRRESFAEEVDDPYIQEFVNEIADMDDDAVRPLLSRVKNWVENGVIRQIISQRESSIDFEEIINDNKIVIVRTPVSNPDIKQMITLGVMRPIWNAIQNRSFEDGENEPFFAIFDEFDAIASQNLDVKNMLARARSMRLSVTIACQYPEQLKEEGVLSAVKANCNNPVMFRIPNDEDARPVAKLFKGYDEEDLMETENYQVWTKIPIKGGMQYSDPLKIRTFAPYPPLRSEDAAEDVIRKSLDQYGTTPLTDAEIQRELPYGQIREGTTPDDASAVDTESDEKTRDTTLKAIYDASIREGNPGGYIRIEACLQRLRDYLAIEDGLKSSGQAWRNVLKDIPESYLSHEERDGEMHVRVESKPFLNVGENENDGGAEHWATMEDAYAPLTQLGFTVDIYEQDTSDMPDAIASIDEALDIPEDADAQTTAQAVSQYRNEHQVLDRLAGAREAYIESEHTTGNTQPSQTVENVMQAYEENKRCLLLARPKTAERVATTLLEAPKGCHKSHDIDGERRFYTLTNNVTIDGEAMTRPGSSDNVWVYDKERDEYILRDDDGTEHACFDSANAVFEDSKAYPMGGDRNVKAPIIPKFDPDMLDIILVPEGAESPGDLLIYSEDGEHVPITELDGNERDGSESDSKPQNKEGDDIVNVLR